MEIFTQGTQGSCNIKVNFVDENNLVLGYSLFQCCCEHAGWFIADKPTFQIMEQIEEPNLEGWVFDSSYFYSGEIEADEDSYDDGLVVIFRIIKQDKERFIHLFNCHNGYYSHGFDFTLAEKVIRADQI